MTNWQLKGFKLDVHSGRQGGCESVSGLGSKEANLCVVRGRTLFSSPELSLIFFEYLIEGEGDATI